MPGYSSCFTRYSPYWYRPAYFHRPWYPGYSPYHHHGSSFSFGFGFYRNCYAYPTYPLVYYPTYYAPIYPAYVPTYYASSVLVTTPTYEYVPEPVVEYPTYVSTEYASADSYMAAGSTVEAPQVVYDTGYDQPVAEHAPPVAAPAEQYADPQAAAPNVYVDNHVTVYPDQPEAAAAQPSIEAPPLPPADSGQQVYPTAPDAVPPPAPQAVPAQPAPQAQVVTPGQAAPQEQPAPAAQPPAAVEPAEQVPAEQAPADQFPEEDLQLAPEQIKELQDLMMSGTQGFAEGRYAEAAEKFEKVTNIDPHNIDAALAHGVARFATGDYTLSAESIRLGVSLFPPIVDSVFDVRERYQKTADFVAQSRKLEEHLGKSPGDVNAMLVLGFVRHFSNQRDLAQQTFEQLKKASPEDADLADVFLHSVPPEVAGVPGTQPAGGAPGTLEVRVNRDPFGVPTTQPGVDAISGGPVDPGVLSVTTQPAPMQKIEIPAAPDFDGKLSLTEADVPRDQTTLDGIEVRLKSTDDAPPQAYIEITIGDRRMKVKRFIPGAHVVLKGASGQEYKLVLTEVDNAAETIRYMVAKK